MPSCLFGEYFKTFLVFLGVKKSIFSKNWPSLKRASAEMRWKPQFLVGFSPKPASENWVHFLSFPQKNRPIEALEVFVKKFGKINFFVDVYVSSALNGLIQIALFADLFGRVFHLVYSCGFICQMF